MMGQGRIVSLKQTGNSAKRNLFPAFSAAIAFATICQQLKAMQ
jgi:hypothetical protein